MVQGPTGYTASGGCRLWGTAVRIGNRSHMSRTGTNRALLLLAILAALAPAPPVLAWTQSANHWPENPQSCDNSSGNICVRWPKTSSNLSVTVYVLLDYSLDAANVDLKADTRSVVLAWNDIAARNPHLVTCTGCGSYYDIYVLRVALPPGTHSTFAGEQCCGSTTDWRGRDYYTSGVIKVASATIWNHNLTCDYSHCDSRAAISHEMGHAEGLGHTSYTSVMGPRVQWVPMSNDVSGIVTIWSLPMTRRLTTLLGSVVVFAAVLAGLVVSTPRSGAGSPASSAPPALVTAAGGTEGPSATVPRIETASPEGPTAPALDTAPPATTAADCVVTRVMSERMPLTLQNVASASSAALVAEFEGYESATWNTSDGSRPARPSIHGSEKLYRPAKLRISDVLTGSVTGATITARVDGGKLGCDSYDFDYSPDLKIGQSYLFFLGYSVDASGTATSDLSLVEAWPIRSDGSIVTPLEGETTINEVRAVVSKISPLPLPTR